MITFEELFIINSGKSKYNQKLDEYMEYFFRGYYNNTLENYEVVVNDFTVDPLLNFFENLEQIIIKTVFNKPIRHRIGTESKMFVSDRMSSIGGWHKF